MKPRLLLIVIFATFLAACSSSQEKQEPATVEDRSSDSEASQDEGYTQSYGTGESSAGEFSSLDDPQNLLSTRVIYFEYDSSDVKTEYRAVVEAHAAYLAAHPDTTVSLEGHADERGSREYNLALGERRSISVKRQMTLLGVDSEQLRVTSYGEERPAIEGHDDYAWSQNRRVEILY